MARTGEQWSQLELRDDVILLLGWREGRRGIAGRPLEVAGDVATVMRETAQGVLTSMANLDARPYAGVPALERGEFLHVDTANLPAGPNAQRAGAEAEAATDDTDAGPNLNAEEVEEIAAAAEVLDLIARVDSGGLDVLTRDEIEGRHWLMYAVVMRDADTDAPIAFVRQWSPQRGMGSGRLMTRLRDRLVKLDDPLFIFDLSFDVVIAEDEIAILNLTAFDRVFADLDPAGAEVPHHVSDARAALTVELTDAAVDRLTSVARAKPSLARRLRRISRAPHLSSVTRPELDAALARHELAPTLFGAGPEVEIAEDEHVRVFLELLEGLYYRADFSGELRRADRYSPRG